MEPTPGAPSEHPDPTHSPSSSSASSSPPPLLGLPRDVSLVLYTLMPVVDLLSLSQACRTSHDHASEEQHWRHLTRRLLGDNDPCPSPRSREKQPAEVGLDASGGGDPSALDASDRKGEGGPGGAAAADAAASSDAAKGAAAKAGFVRRAEAEVNWRRGQLLRVQSERLGLGTGGDSARQPVQALALWKDGPLLAAVAGEVGVFREPAAAAEAEVAEGPRVRLPMLQVAPCGDLKLKLTALRATVFGIVAAGMDGVVRVLDWREGAPKETLEHHDSAAVWGLAVDTPSSSSSPSGAAPPTVAASSFRRVFVSDLRQPARLRPAVSFQGHATWIRALHLETDRHLLVSGSADATCKSWDLRMPGQVVSKFVHPNHFEEVRSVQCLGDKVFTGCYDGIVREFDLGTGRLRRAFADHRPYAVEAIQLGPVGTPSAGRLVSVDWSSVVACVPSTVYGRRDRVGLFRGEDVETLVYGRDCAWTTSPPPAPTRQSPRSPSPVSSGGEPTEPAYDLPNGHAGRPLLAESSGGGDAHLRALDLAYRLSPLLRDGRLAYQRLAAREEPPEVPEAHMSASVCSLAHAEDRVLLGTKHGRVLRLEFGRGRGGGDEMP